MDVTLRELLAAVDEARKVYVAIFNENGLVVAFAHVAKKEVRKAFQDPKHLSEAYKGPTHNQERATYHIQWNEKELFIR